MEITICFISDTHGKHTGITSDWLKTGDILIHAGDISNVGNQREVRDFLKWFGDIPTYDHKVFIAGNHDWLFYRQTELAKQLIKLSNEKYGDITYLQDSSTEIYGVKFYGSPWQPEFYNWAFNLPRGGEQLKSVWDKIPEETDVLITHCAPKMILDKTSADSPENLGCELLMNRVLKVKPAIHTFGHIHGGYGEKMFNDITFLNASSVSEKYFIQNRPIRIKYNIDTKEITFI